MLPRSKRPRVASGANIDDAAVAASVTAVREFDDDFATADKLGGDEIAIIFGFLPLKDIMRLRRVCEKWRDAGAKTMVPPTEFVPATEFVNSVRSYNAMRAMTTALPNLQQIKLCYLEGHKYVDGEDPNEYHAARTANRTAHDIDIISNFRKLLILILYIAPLKAQDFDLVAFKTMSVKSLR